MEKFESLGFKKPDFIENEYGIKIYIGTKGKDDWCIEIPLKLVQEKTHCKIYNKNVVMYFISEEETFNIASEFTNIARNMR